jgi:hypothetical protein
MDKMDKILQDLEMENSQLKTELKKRTAELEERKAAWEMKNERLRAKIKELEEQKADQEAQLNYQKSLAQKLEGFQPVRICNEETKFTVLINTEVEDGLFTEPVGFTFSDYKSMDDFIQMALLHGQNNIRFTIKKGED